MFLKAPGATGGDGSPIVFLYIFTVWCASLLKNNSYKTAS
jgi:hypothetical protein